MLPTARQFSALEVRQLVDHRALASALPAVVNVNVTTPCSSCASWRARDETPHALSGFAFAITCTISTETAAYSGGVQPSIAWTMQRRLLAVMICRAAGCAGYCSAAMSENAAVTHKQHVTLC
jgi:hypothetical protein